MAFHSFLFLFTFTSKPRICIFPIPAKLHRMCFLSITQANVITAPYFYFIFLLIFLLQGAAYDECECKMQLKEFHTVPKTPIFIG